MDTSLEDFYGATLQPTRVLKGGAKRALSELADGTRGYSTRLTGLDKYIRLMPGDFMAIAGRAGVGKTALMMQLVYSVMMQVETKLMGGKDDGAIAVFSAEMDSSSLLLREACARESISFWRLQRGGASEVEVRRLQDRLDRLGDDRLFIDPSSAPTLAHMTEQLYALDQGPGVAAVFFDYLELAGEYARAENQRVREIARGLKAIAKKFDAPVISLAQFSRKAEDSKDDKPNLGWLMQGGEQEMDRVVGLVPGREDVAGLDAGSTLLEAHILKNRNGPVGMCELEYIGRLMQFRDAVTERAPLMEEE